MKLDKLEKPKSIHVSASAAHNRAMNVEPVTGLPVVAIDHSLKIDGAHAHLIASLVHGLKQSVPTVPSARTH